MKFGRIWNLFYLSEYVQVRMFVHFDQVLRNNRLCAQELIQLTTELSGYALAALKVSFAYS